jgi:putative transposase
VLVIFCSGALSHLDVWDYKPELIKRHVGPWRSCDEVELATAGWVDFWNTRRLHSACGDIPPAEFEAAYHQLRAVAEAA